MKEPIRKGELKGVGQSATHVDFEELKKQLESGDIKNKSPFSNFFDGLKDQTPTNQSR